MDSKMIATYMETDNTKRNINKNTKMKMLSSFLSMFGKEVNPKKSMKKLLNSLIKTITHLMFYTTTKMKLWVTTK